MSITTHASLICAGADVRRAKCRALVAALSLFLPACVPSDVSPPLSHLDTEKLSASSYQPEKPYEEKKAGLGAKIAFSGTVDRTGIEVEDLLVLVRASVPIQRSGVTIYELRDGDGTVTIDGKSQAIGSGAVFAAGEGQNVTIENRGQSAMLLRATVFTTH